MKKHFSILLALLLAFSPVALANKVSEDGTSEGQVYDYNFTRSLNVSVSGGEATISSDLFNTGSAAQATLTLASSTTAITDSSLPYAVILKSVGGGGGLDANGTTLPDASTDGQTLTIIIVGLQDGGSWEVTPSTSTGFNSITFDAKAETATLMYVDDTIGWTLYGSTNATLNQD